MIAARTAPIALARAAGRALLFLIAIAAVSTFACVAGCVAYLLWLLIAPDQTTGL